MVIDGHGVAKLKRGRLFEITVTPGPHTVQMTIDWCSSPVVHVDLDVGCDVTLTCGPSSVPSREVMFGGRGATAKYISLELDAE